MPPSVSSSGRGSQSSERVNRLPRYSALFRLMSSGSRSVRNSLSTASSASSQTTLPAYTEFADLLHHLSIISPSMTTLSRPPRYSSGVPQDCDEPPHAGSLNSEYTFTISSSPQSKPWATLRLYDGNSPSSRASTKARHPRFSNLDKMIGSVELSLTSPQTIKAIELKLTGTMIAGDSGDGGVTSFLEHKYTLWDRRFGDPQYLASGRPSNVRYDGKLSGDWVFPFAIPFPSHVDTATRCAVHARGSEGPVRFLPELRNPTLVPFQLGESSGNVQGSVVYEEPGSSETITPFDMTASCRVLQTEKRKARDSTPITRLLPHVPLNAPVTVAPILTHQESRPSASGATPVLRPYAGVPHEGTRNESASRSDDHPNKTSSQRRSRRLTGHSTEHDRLNGTGYLGTATMSESELPLLASSHPLPQSFLEREVMANVHYDLCLVVTHGRLAPTGSRVKSTILYRPITFPPTMPLKRQISLRQRAIPRSPNLDPDVWKRLPAAWIRGVYLDQKTVAIQCTLHLALPLSYARGTLIPCALVVACEDAGALDLFANPRTVPRVRLKRLASSSRPEISVRNGDPALSWFHASPPGGGYGPFFGPPLEIIEHSTPRVSSRKSSHVAPFTPDVGEVDEEDLLRPDDVTHEQVIGDGAVWCMPEHYAQELHVKRLYGEIHLPKGLEATCAFPLFKILYRVELLAPTTGAFVPDAATPGDRSGDERVYTSRFVRIVTKARRDEPVPVRLVGAGVPASAGPSHLQGEPALASTSTS